MVTPITRATLQRSSLDMFTGTIPATIYTSRLV